MLITLTTDAPDEVRDWLPGGQLYHDFLALMHVYLGARVNARLQLRIPRSALPDAQLTSNKSERAVQLGRTAVMRLDNPETKNQLITITLGLWQSLSQHDQRRKPMRLAIIAINFAVITAMSSLVTGCGLTQKVSEGAVSLTKSIFYKEIKTLHLDFSAREAANKNAQGIALSTVVRIYQLRDRKAFDSANYQSLFAQDSTAVKADLLAQKDIRVRPW